MRFSLMLSTNLGSSRPHELVLMNSYRVDTNRPVTQQE